MAAAKTSQQTAPGRRKPRHGKGELRTGGKPGNKGGSGRPRLAFKAYAQELATDPEVQAVFRAKALEGDVSALKLIVQYAEGMPAQPVEHGGAVQVRVTYEDTPA